MDVSHALFMMGYALGILSNCLIVMYTLNTYMSKMSPEFKSKQIKWMGPVGLLAVILPFLVGLAYLFISKRDANAYQIRRCYDELLGEKS